MRAGQKNRIRSLINGFFKHQWRLSNHHTSLWTVFASSSYSSVVVLGGHSRSLFCCCCCCLVCEGCRFSLLTLAVFFFLLFIFYFLLFLLFRHNFCLIKLHKSRNVKRESDFFFLQPISAGGYGAAGCDQHTDNEMNRAPSFLQLICQKIWPICIWLWGSVCVSTFCLFSVFIFI